MANKKPLLDGDPIEPTYAWVVAYNYEGHWHMIPQSARTERSNAYDWFMDNEAATPSGQYPDGAEVKIVKCVLLARLSK